MVRSERLALPVVALMVALAGASAARAEENRVRGFLAPDAGGAPRFACWSMRDDGVHGRDVLICTFQASADSDRLSWGRRCEYASGPVLVLGPTGRALRTCEERIGAGDDARILAPGGTWQRAGIRCENRAGTLRCVNRSGRGFRFDSRRQEVF